MGKKETEAAILDSRAGRVTRVGLVDELLADLNAGDADTATLFDPTEALTSAEAAADFLVAAEATDDPAYIAHAQEFAKRARKIINERDR